jgi:hypothetical protein
LKAYGYKLRAASFPNPTTRKLNIFVPQRPESLPRP